MKNKQLLLKFIQGMEKGFNKEKNEEKLKEKIITFITMDEVEGMFINTKTGKNLTRKELEKEKASELIKEFKKGWNEFKEFVNNS